MALRLDPAQIVVYASTWKRTPEGRAATAAFDAEQPFTVVRDPVTMLLPTPRVTRRAVRLLREHGCTSVWFGAAAPLGLMAPALRRAGCPPSGRHHPRARGGMGAAARGPAAAAADRRGHGHDHVPGGVHPLPDRPRAHPRGRGADGPTAARRRREDLPPGLGRGPDQGRARPLGPAGRRLCVPARAAQGPGHADPRDARDPGAGAGRGAPDRRRRTVRQGAEAAGPGDRGRGVRAVHRTGALGGAARPLRRGRRLRHAVPHPARRPRRGGARHRLPGGLRDRSAGGGGRLGRRARRGARRRDRVGGARRQRGGVGRPDRHAAARPGAAAADGERGRAWVEEKWRWDLLAERLRALL